MDIQHRIHQILQFNDTLAYSILELVDRFPWPMYFRVIWSLHRLESKGLIKSKHIGLKKYYKIK
jgi:hypothetical protein